jgi:hypothetical protein
MDFVVDGVKITLPYNGEMIVQGYLKKETWKSGILFKKSWE